MPRGPRLDTEGALHHVMVRGLEARKIFLSDVDREDFVGRLGDVARSAGMAVYAWSLLSNHFHLLVRTGRESLSRVMRRVLTGYAVSFNRRHRRVGHLFQNRFKSILVEEEAYFMQLVRYIHLNPLRVRLVRDVAELDSWSWSGHSVLMGQAEHSWQSVDYVLGQFGRTAGGARRKYRGFVLDGVGEGRRPDLVGGGLIRSIYGREAAVPLRRGREKWAYDERVLGSSDFVEHVWKEVEQGRLVPTASRDQRQADVDRLVAEIADRLRLGRSELIGGSRRRAVAAGRYVVGYVAVREWGYPAVEVARALNVSSQSILRAVERGPACLREMGLELHEWSR